MSTLLYKPAYAVEKTVPFQLGEGLSYKPNYTNSPGVEDSYIDVQKFYNAAQVGNNDYVIDASGNLWASGTEMGSYLMGGTGDQSTLTIIMTGCYQVFADNYTVWVLKINGELWAFGVDSYGAMGLGDTSSGRPPTLVATLVKQVSVASNRCYYSDHTDTLWCSGTNYYGTIPGTSHGQHSYTFIQAASNVARVWNTAYNVFYREKGTNNAYGIGMYGYGTASASIVQEHNTWELIVGVSDLTEIWTGMGGIFARDGDSPTIKACGLMYAGKMYLPIADAKSHPISSNSPIGDYDFNSGAYYYKGTFEPSDLNIRFIIGFGSSFVYGLSVGTNGSLMVGGEFGNNEYGGSWGWVANGIGACGEVGKGGAVASQGDKLKVLSLDYNAGTYNFEDDTYLPSIGINHVMSRRLQVEKFSNKLLYKGSVQSLITMHP